MHNNPSSSSTPTESAPPYAPSRSKSRSAPGPPAACPRRGAGSPQAVGGVCVPKGCVSGHGDVVLFVQSEEGCLLQVGVQFHLVHEGLDCGGGEEFG